MNKTQAIKQARKEVGELYKLGGGWVFNWYVPDLKDSICQCFCAHGGRWTSYL